FCKAKKDTSEAPTKDAAAGKAVAASLDSTGVGLGASAAIAVVMEAAATRTAHAIFFISMANEGVIGKKTQRSLRVVAGSCLCVCP
ncbi:unnamed protein product, partial [Ilex paraguariensis]